MELAAHTERSGLGAQARFLCWAAAQGFRVVPTVRGAAGPGRELADSLRPGATTSPALRQTLPEGPVLRVQSRPFGSDRWQPVWQPERPDHPDAGRLERLLRCLERRRQDVLQLEVVLAEELLWIAALFHPGRSAAEHLETMVALVDGRRMSPLQALARVRPALVDHMLRPRLPVSVRRRSEWLARGTAAHPGVAVGELVLDSAFALKRVQAGQGVLLALERPGPNDLEAIQTSAGLIVPPGSRAAQWARHWSIP
ncbi:MAG: hypothetical protein AB1758_19285, partial [Candidatus Eremiobacterota bacterium]